MLILQVRRPFPQERHRGAEPSVDEAGLVGTNTRIAEHTVVAGDTVERATRHKAPAGAIAYDGRALERTEAALSRAQDAAARLTINFALPVMLRLAFPVVAAVLVITGGRRRGCPIAVIVVSAAVLVVILGRS